MRDGDKRLWQAGRERERERERESCCSWQLLIAALCQGARISSKAFYTVCDRLRKLSVLHISVSRTTQDRRKRRKL